MLIWGAVRSSPGRLGKKKAFYPQVPVMLLTYGTLLFTQLYEFGSTGYCRLGSSGASVESIHHANKKDSRQKDSYKSCCPLNVHFTSAGFAGTSGTSDGIPDNSGRFQTLFFRVGSVKVATCRAACRANRLPSNALQWWVSEMMGGKDESCFGHRTSNMLLV